MGRGTFGSQLEAPFAEDVLISKPVYEKGRKAGEVTAAPWHEYVRRLNTIRNLVWSANVSHLQVVGEKLLMVVDVTIGDETRSGTGSADADKDSWGGAHAEAFSQAFRRACAMHGLGLYFYGKEDREAQVDPPQPEGPTETQKERLKELAESGAFGDLEVNNWKARLKVNYTQQNAGKIIREMKDAYKLRTGSDYGTQSES